MATKSSDSFIRLPEVQARVGLSKAIIYREVRLGTFPPPVELVGARAVAWIESQVDEWIENKKRTAPIRGQVKRRQNRDEDHLPKWRKVAA